MYLADYYFGMHIKPPLEKLKNNTHPHTRTHTAKYFIFVL